MLTDMHIAIVGGDARQLEVIRKLSEYDAKLSLIGFDQLDDGFVGANKQTFYTIDPKTVDAIVLPVSGMSQEGEIESIFSGEKTFFPENWLKKTPDHTVIYSGISNNVLKKLASNNECQLIELLERDDVAIYNSIPTAEGAVMMVIQNTDITIHDSNVAVTGFGRVGMTVARTFKNLGARVEVIANELNLRARAFEMHLDSYSLAELPQRVKNIDVIINTIPAKVLSVDVLSKMPPHALVIDLASKPGGTDFRYAEKRGIKALLAPGLPGIVAPKTAGKIIANVLTALLLEQWSANKGGSV
ncbi:dipicolinate synthase subunit A [Evansella caseinilytica]|uniref:Dipicolinate synthase subunit A n=1 Tax=Evansella caseinilytica TaxID=1503961 RepID=A0A1H3M0R7_9BACI|nr:dipicolinic acid synthetase subunit A [Evansella caseinilytica]SDY70153.1 dipicolinate synthase subunit A [Evansella caseinilytica]